MRILAILSLVIALLALPACDAILPTGLQEDPEFIALQADLDKTNELLEAAEQDAAATWGEYQATLLEVEHLTEEIRAGNLTAQAASDAAAAISVLVGQAGEAAEDFDRFKARAEELGAKYGDIYGRMEALADEKDTSPWVIGLGLLGTFLTGGAMPTMNNIPILGPLLSGRSSARALEAVKLRHEADRAVARTTRPAPPAEPPQRLA